MNLPPTARREEGPGGLALLAVENAHARAQVFEQGAHVALFQPRTSAQPVLWLSRESLYQEGKTIRGGVPLCFPWFAARADDPDAPMHGIARTGMWNLQSASDEASGTRLVFAPSAELEEDHFWPRHCRAAFEVLVGDSLEMSFEAHNTGSSTWGYEVALHTYFAVDDARLVEVRGLEGTPYWDKVRRTQQRGERGPVRIEGEVDRVYGSSSTCTVRDPSWRREIVIEKQNSESTIVWNPHEKKSRAMPDFGDDEWKQMLCIETANAGRHRIELKPGQSHRMTARISVRELA